jgi:Ca2+-dependent lipid-binding protein
MREWHSVSLAFILRSIQLIFIILLCANVFRENAKSVSRSFCYRWIMRHSEQLHNLPACSL